MNASRVVRAWSLATLVVVACGCNQSTPDSQTRNPSGSSALDRPLVIRTTESPTNGDSREPELNATNDGRIILSWVEKVDERRYALRAAVRDANGWSQSQTVAQGEK